jgi:hypothetical protein
MLSTEQKQEIHTATNDIRTAVQTIRKIYAVDAKAHNGGYVNFYEFLALHLQISPQAARELAQL